jgi:hypothetical protein
MLSVEGKQSCESRVNYKMFMFFANKICIHTQQQLEKPLGCVGKLVDPSIQISRFPTTNQIIRIKPFQEQSTP